MAITDAEMREWYSMILITALRQNNIMVPLCDRAWQAQARTGEEVNIYQDEGNPTASDYTSGDDWGTASDDTDVSTVAHKLVKARKIVTKIPKKTARNVPFNVVTQQAENLGENIAKEIDKYIIDSVMAATLKTGNHVGQYGTSTNYLTDDADAFSNAAGSLAALVWTPLRAIKRKCQDINLHGKAARMNGRMFIIMDGVFDDALSEFLRSDGGADALAYEQVTGRGPDMMNGYRGTIWNNFDLYVTNTPLTKQYASKNHSFLFAGNGASMAYSETEPQIDYWPPEGSPFGPYYRFNGLFEYGWSLTKNDRLVSAAVRRAA